MWSSPPRLALPLALSLAMLALGCVDDPAEDPSAAGRVFGRAAEPKPGEVAARVDGVPITVGDVRELVDETDGGLGPAEALDALVRQQLLAAEAERREFTGHGEVLSERRNALASALIDRLADEVSLETLDQQKLRTVYEQRLNKFVHGPKRRVIHAVARIGKKRLTDEQARQLAARVGEAASGATNRKEFRRAVLPLVAEHGRKKLRIETLPPFHEKTKKIAAPFVAAAFGLPGPGHLSEPFQTKWGWHVLLVLEELPARNTSFEEAREIIGAEVVPLEQRELVDGLVDELSQKAGVFVYETQVVSGAEPQ